MPLELGKASLLACQMLPFIRGLWACDRVFTLREHVECVLHTHSHVWAALFWCYYFGALKRQGYRKAPGRSGCAMRPGLVLTEVLVGNNPPPAFHPSMPPLPSSIEKEASLGNRGTSTAQRGDGDVLGSPKTPPHSCSPVVPDVTAAIGFVHTGPDQGPAVHGPRLHF